MMRPHVVHPKDQKKKKLQRESLNLFLITVLLIMLALCIEIKQMSNHVDVTRNWDFLAWKKRSKTEGQVQGEDHTVS